MVVDDHDAERGHGAARSAAVRATCVPAGPGAIRAPPAQLRGPFPHRDEPDTRHTAVGEPRPSSSPHVSSPSGSRSDTRHRDAPACRTALVSASGAIR